MASLIKAITFLGLFDICKVSLNNYKAISLAAIILTLKIKQTKLK